FFFFFSSRRRHTRFSRDWSSDVCSSDLGADYEAWCEWDIELWFSEGQPAAQTLIWRTLLNRSTLLAEQGQNRLLQAISASRKGRSEERRVGKESRRRGAGDDEDKRR